jgi:hypothetical protein
MSDADKMLTRIHQLISTQFDSGLAIEIQRLDDHLRAGGELPAEWGTRSGEGETEGCTCCQTRAASSVTGYECPRCGHLPKSHGGAVDELKLTLREVAQTEAALDGEPAVIPSLAELLRGNPWER